MIFEPFQIKNLRFKNRILEEIIIATRKKVGDDYPIGIRLSAADYNYLPLNLRLPVRFPLKQWYFGNTIKENLYFEQKLKALGIDYLHIDKGYGFPNPKGNPGRFPVHEIKMFNNAGRHLSFKSWMRATIFNLIPEFIFDPVANMGWKYVPGISADEAKLFKEPTGLPVIANGVFQERALIESTLKEGKADLVAIVIAARCVQLTIRWVVMISPVLNHKMRWRRRSWAGVRRVMRALPNQFKIL